MSLIKFYDTFDEVEDLTGAAIADQTGGSTTRENMLNNRKHSLLEVDSVAGGYYRVRMDLSRTKTPDFIAIVNHNITGEVSLEYNTADDTNWVDILLAVDTETPSADIWVATIGTPATKQYWRLRVDGDATLEWGCFLMGAEFDPGVDPKHGKGTGSTADASGIKTTRSGGGNTFKTERYAITQPHKFIYEVVPFDTLVLFRTFRDNNIGRPFVYARHEKDGDLSYHYGKINEKTWTETEIADNIYRLSFTIEQEV